MRGLLSSKNSPLIIGFMVFVGYLFSRLIISEQLNMLFVGMVGLGILWMSFKVEEKYIPAIVFIFLVLSSSSNYKLAQSTYYYRFVIFLLFSLRGLLSLLKQREVLAEDGPTFRSLRLCFLGLGGYGILSSLYSVNPRITFLRATTFLLLIFVIYFYLWNACREKKDFDAYTSKLVLAFLGIIGFGWLMYFSGGGNMYKGGRLRLVVGNPNLLGHLCAIMLPLVSWYIYEKKRHIKVYWALYALILISIVLAGSRAGILTSFFGMLILISRCYPKKLFAGSFGIVIFVALYVLVGSDGPQTLNEDSYLQEKIIRADNLATGSGRIGVWKSAEFLISQSPLVGYGFGITDKLFALGMVPGLPMEFQGGHFHNGYIEELVNLGILGALPMFLCFLVILISQLLARKPKDVDEEMYKIKTAFFCCFVAGLISSVFESWLTSVGSVFCFPFWLSIMMLLRIQLGVKE